MIRYDRTGPATPGAAVNDRFAEARLVERMGRCMADTRFLDGRDCGHELRAFVLADIWAEFAAARDGLTDKDAQVLRRQVYGMPPPAPEPVLSGDGTAMFFPRVPLRRNQMPSMTDLLREDAPRYEPTSWGKRTKCPVVLSVGPRKGDVCGGEPRRSRVRVTDPATGEWEMVGWCRNHETHWEAAVLAERAFREQPAGLFAMPEPTPTIGGLLPCHITDDRIDWDHLYGHAREGWVRPGAGIKADDWEVNATAAEQARVARKNMLLVDGGGQRKVTVDGEPVRPAPELKVIK